MTQQIIGQALDTPGVPLGLFSSEAIAQANGFDASGGQMWDGGVEVTKAGWGGVAIITPQPESMNS